MKRLFENPKDLDDYLFRITDNGGSSADRYTVAFSDGSYLGLSSYPSHPQGISISGEALDPEVMTDWVESGQAVDLALGDLPQPLINHILYRNNEGFGDFLERVEAKDPAAVAANRDAAEVNDGLHTSSGEGIYWTEDAYHVRLDGPPDDDRGPFIAARQAVLASLPDRYGLAGPEHHSTVDVMRLAPDEGVLAQVVALEAKREAEWRNEAAAAPAI